jgi:erythromycin esterase
MGAARLVAGVATRTGIIICLAFTLLGSAASITPDRSTATDDAIQRWITTAAVNVRSIAATDDDFSDLEPLTHAIGPARVVQLGEPSHGAGSSFEAKVRLVKFLHQRMGFDVLVWESGLYDVRLTDAGLRAGEEPTAAAQRGIFSIWSSAAEVKPLFEYVQASRATLRPVEMAGFDLQFTSDVCFNRFAADLRSFVLALPDATLRANALQLVDQAVSAYQAIRGRIETLKRISETMLRTWERQDAPGFRRDRQRLLENADQLLAILRDDRAQFLQVHSAQQVDLIAHITENMRTGGLNLYDVIGPDRPAGTPPFAPRLEVEDRRDALNASNLRWLIQQVYAGKKLIVWAHNAHVMNAYYASDWRTLYVDPHPGTMTPTGVFLKKWLEDQVYTIVMTTYEGQDGWAGAHTLTPVPPAPDGSLEERLHRLGKPYIFIDLRSRQELQQHPAHSAQTLRIPKYETNTLHDPSRVADGIFYLDHMAAATANH